MAMFSGVCVICGSKGAWSRWPHLPGLCPAHRESHYVSGCATGPIVIRKPACALKVPVPPGAKFANPHGFYPVLVIA